MRRLSVKCICGDCINIPADKLITPENDINYIYVECNGETVGIFDMGSVSTLYLYEDRKADQVQ